MNAIPYRKRRQMKRQLRAWRRQAEWKYADEIFADRDYIACVKDILEDPVFCSMANYIQHGTTSTREHCVQVSYCAYTIARMLHANYTCVARAGLLHDLFLYDWHDLRVEEGTPFWKLHGFTHPRKALKNAERHFHLNKVEKDCILCHMWPMTIIPPKFTEGYILCYADKYCAAAEVAVNMRKKITRPIVGLGRKLL